MVEKFPSLPVEPTPAPQPLRHDPDPRAPLVSMALRLLSETDYVTVKAVEQSMTLSPAWLSWREDLRRAVRGERNDIPLEPPRYGNAPPPPPPHPIAPVIVLDPLDPANWRNVDDARAALMTIVMQIAARKVGHSTTLYERMCYLDSLGAAATDDQRLELMQHQDWAEQRLQVEASRVRHVYRIQQISTLEQALAYDVHADWPEDAAS